MRRLWFMKHICLIVSAVFAVVGVSGSVYAEGEKGAGVLEKLDVMEADAAEVDEDEEVEVDLEKLPPSPMKLVGRERISLGEFTEVRVAEFTAEFENTSKEEVFYKRTMSTCVCLTVLDGGKPGVVPPGGRIQVKAKIEGNKLGHRSGKWTRALYVETKGFAPYGAEVAGTLRSMLKISPAATLKLGSFEGYDINWERKVTVELNRPEDCPDLVVEAPKDSKHFSFELKLVDEKVRRYELTIRPKLPMSAGRVSEAVILPTPKLGKETGVRLRLLGNCKGRRYSVSPAQTKIDRKELGSVQGIEKTFKLTVDDTGGAGKRRLNYSKTFGLRIQSDDREKKGYRKDVVCDIASEESGVLAKRDWKGYWSELDKTLDVRGGAGLTVTRNVVSDGIEIKVTVPAGYKLDNSKGYRRLFFVTQGDKPIGKFMMMFPKAAVSGRQGSASE